jgi:hypothetical protein
MSSQADQVQLENHGPTFEPITGANPLSHVSRTHTNGSGIHRTHTKKSEKESRDPNLDINLPYRTLSPDANLDEFTSEREPGEIPVTRPEKGKPEYKLVTFVPNDPENPKNWSKAYKWWCTMVVAFTCFVVAFCSSVITADIIDVQKEFGKSEEVVLLSITLFVVGFGIGTHTVSRHLETKF